MVLTSDWLEDLQNEVEELRPLKEDKELAVWFTPDAIRDHLEADPAFEKSLEVVKDERLREVMRDEMDRADLWELFDRICKDVLDAAMTCPECGQVRPGDERVAAGMKCGYCAYCLPG